MVCSRLDTGTVSLVTARREGQLAGTIYSSSPRFVQSKSHYELGPGLARESLPLDGAITFLNTRFTTDLVIDMGQGPAHVMVLETIITGL